MKNLIFFLIVYFFLILQNYAQTIKDIDGNVYNSQIIGKQCWMVENLKTTRFNDGTEIPNVINDSVWVNLNTPGYCYYKNDATINKDNYGSLYNWYAVSDSHKLCPSGWHVPTANEWIALVDYLGGKKVAGGKLKETGTNHWESSNKGATDEIKFSALPGGFRSGVKNGSFYKLGSLTMFWSSTQPIYHVLFEGPPKKNPPVSWFITLFDKNKKVRYRNYIKPFGFSVRCVKDN